MNILIVGAGMYVTGREGTGTGTVLAALAECSRRFPISRVTVVARSEENAAHVAAAAQRINGLLGTKLDVRYERLTAQRTLAQVAASGRYDCAVVSVPDHAHFETTRVLLEAKVPPLVVKPLTPTLQEARELVRLSRTLGVYGAVEFHKRFDETNLYARKAVDAKMLGQLLYITVDYSQRISIPTVVFRDWARTTNIFQYLAVHYVDLIHFLTGYLPTRVMAVGTRGTLKEQGITEFDSVHATLLWTSPDRSQTLLSVHATNWIDSNRSSAMSDQKYKIIGTKGRLELDQKNRGVELVTDEVGVQQINPYFSEFLPDPDRGMSFSGYGHRSIERFLLDVQDLRAGKVSTQALESARPSFHSSLPSVAVTEAVNASLANDSAWETIGEIF
jgi:D-galacturonate reductase